MSCTGLALIISGPSSVGKSRVIARLLKLEAGLKRVVSATTRRPRAHETQGVDYFFLREAEFDAALSHNDFIGWIPTPFGRYATPRQPLTGWLEAGAAIVLDLDPGGVPAVRRLGVATVTIMLLPTSLSALRLQLESRGAERGITTPADVQERLRQVGKYVDGAAGYDFVLINNDEDETAALVSAILRVERRRAARGAVLEEWKRQNVRQGE